MPEEKLGQLSLLEQFAQDVRQGVRLRCAENEPPDEQEREFTEWVLEQPAEHNEVDETDLVYHRAESGGPWPLAKLNTLEIADVVVQVKLTVLKEPERIGELVPLIAKFANSQNKVNAAVLPANGPFHHQLEQLCRTVWAAAWHTARTGVTSAPVARIWPTKRGSGHRHGGAIGRSRIHPAGSSPRWTSPSSTSATTT